MARALTLSRIVVSIALSAWLLPSIAAVEVTIDTSAARSVLLALQNPELTRGEALAIARMPGNQAMIRKILSFDRPASADLFADALLAAAKSQPATIPMFNFDRVRPNAKANLAGLDAIDQASSGFKAWVADRVRAFSPTALPVTAEGVVIAGGPASGFAFDEPVAYLNINPFGDDAAAVRLIMAHEIFHAVQAAAAKAVTDRRVLSFDQKEFASLGSDAARRCYALEAFLGDFMQEGTASLVGDVMTLTGDEGASSKSQRQMFASGLSSVQDSLTLLELSVMGLTATPQAAYERVYALGFYEHELLYYPGYVVAKALATDLGPGAIGSVIGQPGSAFLRRYMALPLYGKDAAHPRLGLTTERWARQLNGPCARRPASVKR